MDAPAIEAGAEDVVTNEDGSIEVITAPNDFPAVKPALEKAGFNLKPGEHPIIPVMLGDAALAGRMAELLLQRGVYVIGFSFPVVPKGQARIRTQMSAALTREQLDRAIEAFTSVGKEIGVIN